jgi:hypothetical protein
MGQGLSREVGTQFRRVRPELRSFAPRLYAKGRTPPDTLGASVARGLPSIGGLPRRIVVL